MQYTLSETLEENGPTAFPRKLLSKHPDLYKDRVALFFTPTANLPPRVVGQGPLDVFLPLCTPDYYEFIFIRSYMSPRLWVNLLQRHTGFKRWTAFPRATVTITRCDTRMIRKDHLIVGTKALLDALKVRQMAAKMAIDSIISALFATIALRTPRLPIIKRKSQRLSRAGTVLPYASIKRSNSGEALACRIR